MTTRNSVSAEERKLAGSATLRAVLAASLGTTLSWYDFCVFLVLVPFLMPQFFPADGGSFLIAAAAIYCAGFLMQPAGALIFGRLGDLVGRRHVFLVTLGLMGASTFAIGLLPTHGAIGLPAPMLLVAVRLLQGLALGGHHGAAAIYAAEHIPDRRRGLATSAVQAAATVGLFLALLAVGLCRIALDPVTFGSWGWRLPFLLSLGPLVLAVPLWAALVESPVFQRLGMEGKRSGAPLADGLLDRVNARYVLLALLGATAGQGVIWYTGQVYPLSFLTTVLKVDDLVAYGLVGTALLLALPFFAFFGWLSDRIGRLKVIMAGCLVAALTYFPLFQVLTHYANPALEEYRQKVPISVAADDCGVHVFSSPALAGTDCDKVRDHLARSGLSFVSLPAVAGETVVTTIGSAVIKGWRPAALAGALETTGYPPAADPDRVNYPMVLAVLALMAVYVAMVSAPIAAFLAELFPARIRQTSVSLPFHIGHGWFGGMVPPLAAALAASSGNIYQGLWYPIMVALFSMVLGTLFLTETKDRSIHMLERTELGPKV